MIRTHLIIVLCSVLIPLALLFVCAFARFKFVAVRRRRRRHRRHDIGTDDGSIHSKRTKTDTRSAPVDPRYEQSLRQWATFGNGDHAQAGDGRLPEREGEGVVFSRWGITPVAEIRNDGTRNYLGGLFALSHGESSVPRRRSHSPASADERGSSTKTTRRPELRDDDDGQRLLFRSDTRKSGQSHFSMQGSRRKGHEDGFEANEMGALTTRSSKAYGKLPDDDAWNEDSTESEQEENQHDVRKK